MQQKKRGKIAEILVTKKTSRLCHRKQKHR